MDNISSQRGVVKDKSSTSRWDNWVKHLVGPIQVTWDHRRTYWCSHLHWDPRNRSQVFPSRIQRKIGLPCVVEFWSWILVPDDWLVGLPTVEWRSIYPTGHPGQSNSIECSSSHLHSRERRLTCQWWKTDMQNAWPWVCVRRSVSKPIESIAGRNAFNVYKGEPDTGASSVTWPLRRDIEWWFSHDKQFPLTDDDREQCTQPRHNQRVQSLRRSYTVPSDEE
jgi:hypothetical protein